MILPISSSNLFLWYKWATFAKSLILFNSTPTFLNLQLGSTSSPSAGLIKSSLKPFIFNISFLKEEKLQPTICLTYLLWTNFVIKLFLLKRNPSSKCLVLSLSNSGKNFKKFFSIEKLLSLDKVYHIYIIKTIKLI